MRVLAVTTDWDVMTHATGHILNTLAQLFRQDGHKFDSFVLPYSNIPLLLDEEIHGYNLFNLKEGSDLLITIGYPVCCINHPNKKVILFGLSKEFHDLYDTEYGILGSVKYHLRRNRIHQLERLGLTNSRLTITNSEPLKQYIQKEYAAPVTCRMIPQPYYASTADSLQHFKKYYLIETSNQPYEQTKIITEALRNSTQSWNAVFCFYSHSVVYLDSFIRSIPNDVAHRVKILYEPASEQIIENASGCIVMNMGRYEIPRLVIQAQMHNVPIIAAHGSQVADTCSSQSKNLITFLDVHNGNLNDLISSAEVRNVSAGQLEPLHANTMVQDAYKALYNCLI